MKAFLGIIFILCGAIGVFVALRVIYRIIKLKIYGISCTATIVDFYEKVYRNPKAHFIRIYRVTAYPIVSFKTTTGKTITTRTLDYIANKRLKKWNKIRDSYIGQGIDIVYLDESPWILKNAKDQTHFNTLCMRNKFCFTLLLWIVILLLCGVMLPWFGVYAIMC